MEMLALGFLPMVILLIIAIVDGIEAKQSKRYEKIIDEVLNKKGEA